MDDQVSNITRPGHDPDAHTHPLTPDMKHALDWSAGPDDDTTTYVHSHPHDPDHGTPLELTRPYVT